MKIQSLWKHDNNQDLAVTKTWLGTLMTTVEIDFTPASILLTLGSPPQKLLQWLETKATGQWAIQYLRDGRAVIATSTKYDSFVLRSDFEADLDFSIVTTDRSPEAVARFLKQFDRQQA